MMDTEELLEFANIYEKSKSVFKGEIRVGIPLISDDKHKCTAGLDKLVIKYDGTVLPCPAFKEYDLSTLNRIGIRTPNIFTDLSSVKVHNGTRSYPLCKKLYDFTGTIK
jgi:MoaA/NifB/PqqE/SkfB family radical SAM enzyme